MRAVVPLKLFAHAKQRLAGALSDDERRGLMQAMVSDVLHALARTPALCGVLLVSREPDAVRLAAETGAEVFAEPPRADLSEAVQAAGGYLMARYGATGTMIVPGDIPLAGPEDFTAVLARHRQLTLVPDNEGVGTNCIVSTPPNLIRYQFDGNSFKPHMDAAYAIGITPGICRVPSLGLDIDTPADLSALIAHLDDAPGGTATRRFVTGQEIAARMSRALARSG